VTMTLHTNHADLDLDLAKVAVEVGVFATQEPDVTGGLDQLHAILREKTSANPTVVEGSTVESATTPVTPPRSRALGVLRRVQAWARRAVKTVRETLAWLHEPFAAIAARRRVRRETPDYTGRHRTESTWYGAQRSTASRVAIQRRRMAGRQPDDSEPALPEYWVSHMVRAIETIRGHEDVLHPKRGYQFTC
jgi:hypothetical protein